MKIVGMILIAASLALSACNLDASSDSLCEAVANLNESWAEGSTALHADLDPDALAAARVYRDLAGEYRSVAGFLSHSEGVESIRELASLFDQSADVLKDHGDANAEEMERLRTESPVLRSLERRMAGEPPLGLLASAWQEIDAACDVAVDTTAGK